MCTLCGCDGLSMCRCFAVFVDSFFCILQVNYGRFLCDLWGQYLSVLLSVHKVPIVFVLSLTWKSQTRHESILISSVSSVVNLSAIPCHLHELLFLVAALSLVY